MSRPRHFPSHTPGADTGRASFSCEVGKRKPFFDKRGHLSRFSYIKYRFSTLYAILTRIHGPLARDPSGEIIPKRHKVPISHISDTSHTIPARARLRASAWRIEIPPVCGDWRGYSPQSLLVPGRFASSPCKKDGRTARDVQMP